MSDETGAPTPPPPGPIATPLDALGRELFALRSIAMGLVALVDAALTSYEVARMGMDARAAASTSADVERVATELRDALGARAPGKRPPTFGDRLREHGLHDSASDDGTSAAPEGLHVPDVGSDLPTS